MHLRALLVRNQVIEAIFEILQCLLRERWGFRLIWLLRIPSWVFYVSSWLLYHLLLLFNKVWAQIRKDASIILVPNLVTLVRKECATKGWRCILETTHSVERICSRAVGLIIIHLAMLIIRRLTYSGFKILSICVHQAWVLRILRLLSPSIAQSLVLGVRQWILTCSEWAGSWLEHWITRGRVVFSCYWISLASW